MDGEKFEQFINHFDEAPLVGENGLTTEPELPAQQVIGEEDIRKANDILQKYKAGKAALDKRIVDNELWFRMGYWKNYENKEMQGKPKPSSGWLFNSIANKHADAMDNYPEPNVLPRAEDDEKTAKALSKILPTVLEQCDYETVYSDTWWRKLKTGTGVKGVFWDPAARGGLGEICIRSVNLLMLYWEPGVEDIQDTPHLFSLSLMDNDQLEGRYTQMAGHTGSSMDVAKYIHDDSIDTSDKSVVVDWYYKKALESGQTVLHYCKYCNGVVLYASENDPQYAQRGFYDHGKYPFVFDPLFREEDSPAGETGCKGPLCAERHSGCERRRAGRLWQGHRARGGQADGRQFPAFADQCTERQLHQLPGCTGERAEGNQRQPGCEPGRNHQRPDSGKRHCGFAGGGQQT